MQDTVDPATYQAGCLIVIGLLLLEILGSICILVRLLA